MKDFVFIIIFICFYNYIYLMIYSKSILILLKLLSPKHKKLFLCFGLEETPGVLLIPHKGGSA